MTERRDDDFSDSGDHGSVADDVDGQQQRRLSHSRPASSQITLQDLEKYYDVPLTEVAKRLNISITMLKKLCRKFGINRWPHRQIRSINNTIVALQEQIATCQTEDERARIQEQIESMRRKRRLVCRSASCGLNAALRNAIFLARPGELDEEVLFEQGLLPNLQAAMTHKIKSESSRRISTSDTTGFPLNEFEGAGMGHINKYRATNRRERAGTAATLPYGTGMVMPNAAAQLAPMPPHFGDTGEHFDYRPMHQQFGGLAGATPGQYPVGSASLQQHFMQHYSRSTTPLDTFSGSHMTSRPHPLTGLPPSSGMPDQASIKPGTQMPQGIPGYGSQANQQLQSEQQMLLQWQMMQHNAPAANFPSLSMYAQGAGQPGVLPYGQALGGGAAGLPSGEVSGIAGSNVNISASASAGAGGSGGGGGGGGGASSSAAAGGTGIGGSAAGDGLSQSQFQAMGNTQPSPDNLKRMYGGFGAYDSRAQQSAASGGVTAGGANAHNPEQFSDMAGQDYLRASYRGNDNFENAAFAHGVGGANLLSSQFSEYRSREGSQSQVDPARNDVMREVSEFSGYNITI